MASPKATVSMLYQCPAPLVFDAFAHSETITRFWLARSSGPLGEGAKVRWDFMIASASDTITVTMFERGEHLAFTWSDGGAVAMIFQDLGNDLSSLSITATGMSSWEDAVGTAEGFTIVLCDLKTLLESGVSANLVRDKAALIMRQSS